MKKILAFALICGLTAFVGAVDRYLSDYVQHGQKDYQLVQRALDSNGVDFKDELVAIVDTALGEVVMARLGPRSTGVDTLVAAETLKTVLYACPTTGVTSVTIRNIDVVAMTPPAIPNNSSTKVAWLSIKNMDASDSLMHNIVTRKTLDSAAVVAMTAYLPTALTIDSTAFAVLYPGDIVWGFLCADTLCTAVREFNAILNLSINK